MTISFTTSGNDKIVNKARQNNANCAPAKNIILGVVNLKRLCFNHSKSYKKIMNSFWSVLVSFLQRLV